MIVVGGLERWCHPLRLLAISADFQRLVVGCACCRRGGHRCAQLRDVVDVLLVGLLALLALLLDLRLRLLRADRVTGLGGDRSGIRASGPITEEVVADVGPADGFVAPHSPRVIGLKRDLVCVGTRLRQCTKVVLVLRRELSWSLVFDDS